MILLSSGIEVLYIGTLNKQLAICKVDSQGNVIGGQPGCYNLIPVFDWIRRCIISIFLVFFIAFLPLFLQGGYFLLEQCNCFLSCYPIELVERGTGKALLRLGQAFPFGVSHFRGLLHANILPGHFEQFNIRWCSLHCHWSWFCHHSHLLQHPVLSDLLALASTWE